MATDIATTEESYTDTDTDTDNQKNKIYPLTDMWRYRFKHNMSYTEIAEKMGCCKATVLRKLQRYLSMLPNAEEIKAFQDNKSDMLTALELVIHSEMCNPEKIKAASLNNLAYAIQNIGNINRLEQGKSTVNAACVISIQHQEIAQRVLDGIVAAEVGNL